MSLETDDAMSEVVEFKPRDAGSRTVADPSDMTPQREAHRDLIVARHAAEMRQRYTDGQRSNGGDLFAKPGMLAQALEENIDEAFYLRTLGGQLSDLAQALRDGAFTTLEAAAAIERLLRP
jgi:hypothetical protein